MYRPCPPTAYFEIRKRFTAGIFTVARSNSRKLRGGGLSVIDKSSLSEAFCCRFNSNELTFVQCL